MPGTTTPADPAATTASRTRLLLVVAAGCGVTVASLGCVVVAGWLFDVAALTRVLPGLSSMKLATALCLVAVGTGIVAASGLAPRVGRAAVPLGGIAAAFALVVLSEYAVGASYGIDNVGGLDRATTSPNPGRMSGATAIALVSLGVSLVLLRLGRALAGQLVALVALVIAGFTLIGYAYGVDSLYRIAPFSSIAVHTAAALLVAATAALLLRPEAGFVALFAGDGAGGVVARQLLPFALLAPAAGAVMVTGIRGGLYDGAVALALYATACTIGGGVLVWRVASRLRSVDVQRAEAEAAHARATDALVARDAMATELRASADELRRANADLSDFSAAMAHDLRTPLTVVKGYAELLLSHDFTAEESAGWLERIGAAADRGAQLIDDILAFARLGREHVVLADVELGPLAEAAGAEGLAASSRHARLEVAALPVVAGDPALLRQLVDNLVGNALKYVPTDREPVICVDAATDRDSGWPVLRVSDNGDPIPAADREGIFDMFQRGSRPGEVAGSGVGLAMCRRIAELHGGRLWLEESDLGGARFCVLLRPARSRVSAPTRRAGLST